MRDLIKDSILYTSRAEHKQFLDLTEHLLDAMTDFCLLTLKILSEKKEEPLDARQIDDIISFDLQFRLHQIQNPEFLDIIRSRAKSRYNPKKRAEKTPSAH